MDGVADETVMLSEINLRRGNPEARQPVLVEGAGRANGVGRGPCDVVSRI